MASTPAAHTSQAACSGLTASSPSAAAEQWHRATNRRRVWRLCSCFGAPIDALAHPTAGLASSGELPHTVKPAAYHSLSSKHGSALETLAEEEHSSSPQSIIVLEPAGHVPFDSSQVQGRIDGQAVPEERSDKSAHSTTEGGDQPTLVAQVAKHAALFLGPELSGRMARILGPDMLSKVLKHFLGLEGAAHTVTALGPEKTAVVVSRLGASQAAGVAQGLGGARVAELIHNMGPDGTAELVSSCGVELTADIVRQLGPENVRDIVYALGVEPTAQMVRTWGPVQTADQVRVFGVPLTCAIVHAMGPQTVGALVRDGFGAQLTVGIMSGMGPELTGQIVYGLGPDMVAHLVPAIGMSVLPDIVRGMMSSPEAAQVAAASDVVAETVPLPSPQAEQAVHQHKMHTTPVLAGCATQAGTAPVEDGAREVVTQAAPRQPLVARLLA